MSYRVSRRDQMVRLTYLDRVVSRCTSPILAHIKGLYGSLTIALDHNAILIIIETRFKLIPTSPSIVEAAQLIIGTLMRRYGTRLSRRTKTLNIVTFLDAQIRI